MCKFCAYKIHPNLNKKEKMKIIFELLITIQFLHFKSQIYRDLKPNNIIIDENKNIVLIDFDRLVECQKDNICDGESVDIRSKYMAPEIMEKQNYSFSADIYSIAQIIYYILCEEEPTSALNINNPNLQSFLDFYKKCTNIDPMQRPTISQIIHNFLFGFGPLYENNVKFDKNLIEMYENNLLILDDENIIPIDLITLEKIYRNEMYTKKDFMKIVYYVNLFMYKNRSIALDSQAFVYENSDFGKALEKYTESANLNNPDAQFYLGQLYYIGDKVECDVEKGINYLQLSANGNNGKASFLLGLIYLNDEKVKKDINKATFYLKKAADLNEPDAQYVYGDLFFKGENVPFDFNKAIEYFTRAANNNSIDALLSLGSIYYDGKYVAKNLEKSIHFYKIAARLNNSDAQYFFAYIIISNQINNVDIREAIGYLMLSVNKEQIDAIYLLGILYINGNVIYKNTEKGIELLQKAANHKNLNAIYYLSVFTLNGVYLPQDIPKALNSLTYLAVNCKYVDAQMLLFKYYLDPSHLDNDKSLSFLQMAADNNQPNAQFELGCLYEKGTIFKQNIELAIYYFSLASNQNHADAQMNLGSIYYKMNNIEKSLKYYTLSASNGNFTAQYNLGIWFYEGKIVKKNVEKAIKYFTDSAKQGFFLSQYNLARIYQDDPNVITDIPKSLYYYKLAADPKKGNYAKAQFNLGKIYIEGKITKQDIKLAIYYYELAANQHHEHALNQLANLYLNGQYVEQDIPKAIKYYEAAASKLLPESCTTLGLFYKSGNHVKKDIKKAVEYFKKAAQSEYPKALCELAKIYFSGKEIEQNVDLALQYLNVACEKQYYIARFLMGFYYQTGLYIGKDINKAISFYLNSTHKIVGSMNNLGVCYLSEKNVDRAIVHFNDGVKLNDTLSMHNLGVLYCCEKYNHQNLNESINLLTKSYNDGFTNSLLPLSIALIKLHGLNNISLIDEEIKNDVIKCRVHSQVDNGIFEESCKYIEENFFIYNEEGLHFIINLSNDSNPTKLNTNNKNSRKNIDDSFYSAFNEGTL